MTETTRGEIMTKPNVYILGAKPQIVIEPRDEDGLFFVPSASRLSIEKPDGTLFTVSGADLTQGADDLTYLYQPQTVGYYRYETWIKDSTGREDTAHHGFYVVDRVD
jgi:hypothetical protein